MFYYDSSLKRSSDFNEADNKIHDLIPIETQGLIASINDSSERL